MVAPVGLVQDWCILPVAYPSAGALFRGTIPGGGRMADMVKTIEFGWYYVRHAWRGCSTRANELGALLGGALLALAIWLCSPYLREQDLIEAPTTYWGVAGLTVAMAICSVILSVSGYLYNATFASAGAPLLGAKGTSGENRCRVEDCSKAARCRRYEMDDQRPVSAYRSRFSREQSLAEGRR
jgi:hypothetical protein